MPSGGWIQSLLCGPANTSDGWWCALDWIYRQGADDAGSRQSAVGEDRKLFQVPNRILPKTIRTRRAHGSEKLLGKKHSGKLHHNKRQLANWLQSWQQTAALSLKLLAHSVFFVL